MPNRTHYVFPCEYNTLEDTLSVARFLLRHPNWRVFDVRIDEDVAALPFLLPRAERVDFRNAAANTGPALVYCHKGLKLSVGAAAALTGAGQTSEILKGGAVAWSAQNGLRMPLSALPESKRWTTTESGDALLLRWLVKRLLPADHQLLIVPDDDALAVETAFDAPLVTSESFLERFGINWPVLHWMCDMCPNHADLLQEADIEEVMTICDTMFRAALRKEASA